MVESDLLQQPCNKSNNAIKLVTSFLTACSKLVTTNYEQAVRTQLVDNLGTDLKQLKLQVCKNLYTRKNAHVVTKCVHKGSQCLLQAVHNL